MPREPGDAENTVKAGDTDAASAALPAGPAGRTRVTPGSTLAPPLRTVIAERSIDQGVEA